METVLSYTKSFIGFLTWYSNVHLADKSNADRITFQKDAAQRYKEIKESRYGNWGEIADRMRKDIAEAITLLKTYGATE